MKYFVLGIAVLMYVLVIAFQEKKVWFTSAAALILVALGMIFPNGISRKVRATPPHIGFSFSRIVFLKSSIGTS